MKRRLAAILAADVVGYSRLMGEDETGTLAALRQLRTELFAPAVAGHRGKVIKSMGDGWLVEFSSAVDAVNCALRIQDKLIANDIIKLRIGIHIGDVVHENEDIFGDGVNIAARLQEVAAPCSVSISDSTFGSLDGTLTPLFDNGGIHELKNIKRPVQIWLRGQANESIPAQQQSVTDRTTSKGLPTLSIIPITTADDRLELRELADALTFDLATYLDAPQWLVTTIRESPKESCYEFRANLRGRQNRLRLEAKLTASPNDQIWAAKFDGDLEESFEWQDTVGVEIAAHVAERIIDAERKSLLAKSLKDLSAEECLFLANEDVNSTDEGEMLSKALRFISLAIEKNPELELAYQTGISWLGSAISMGYKGHVTKYLTHLPSWRAKVEQLASTGSQSYPMSGVSLRKDAATRFREVEQQLRRAPFESASLTGCGAQYTFLGEPQLALECFHKAKRLGITSATRAGVGGLMAIASVMLEDYDGAVDLAQKSLKKFHASLPPLRGLASAYAHLGQMDEAAKAVKIILERFPEDSVSDTRDRSGYVDNPAVNRYLDGLRMAGLPE